MRTPDYLAYRYPRTTEEAFGCDARSAYAISRHRYRRVILTRWIVRATIIALAVLAGVGVMT